MSPLKWVALGAGLWHPRPRLTQREGHMGALVPIGTVITLLGLVGLLYCIFAVVRARRAKLDDEAMKARLQRVVAWNLGALAVSGLGLMVVIVGLFLG